MLDPMMYDIIDPIKVEREAVSVRGQLDSTISQKEKENHLGRN